MKKIILACVAAILSLSFVHARETTEGQTAGDVSEEHEFTPIKMQRLLSLGVTAGVNMTAYSGDRNAAMGIGGQIGINCDIPVSEHFSIMPELIFTNQSVKLDNVAWDVEGNAVKTTSTDNLFYMNVPVTLKWSTYLGAGRPFIALGPMLNVGLYGKNKIKGSDTKLLLFQPDPNSDYREYREKAYYNDVDFSVYLKLGYDFDFGLSIAAALQWGLANMYKMDDERKSLYTESELNTSQKNRTIYVSLGYNF